MVFMVGVLTLVLVYRHALASAEYAFEKIDPGFPRGLVESLTSEKFSNVVYYDLAWLRLPLSVLGVVLCFLGVFSFLSPSKSNENTVVGPPNQQ